MSGQIHQNIDSVVAYNIYNLIIGMMHDSAPPMYKSSHPIGHMIGHLDVGIAEYFKFTSVMMLKNRFKEI